MDEVEAGIGLLLESERTLRLAILVGSVSVEGLFGDNENSIAES